MATNTTGQHDQDDWRFGRTVDHQHAGSNRGPGDRPIGWRTGGDAAPMAGRSVT
jgi:hypothetical protein